MSWVQVPKVQNITPPHTPGPRPPPHACPPPLSHPQVPEVQKNSHPANKVSTIKYTLVQQLIKLGVHTLVSDMDLVYMENPFDHLFRDADIESQTDGFSTWAYGVFDGVSDKSMGWGGGGLFVKTFTCVVGVVGEQGNER